MLPVPGGGPDPMYSDNTSPRTTSSPGMLTTSQWCLKLGINPECHRLLFTIHDILDLYATVHRDLKWPSVCLGSVSTQHITHRSLWVCEAISDRHLERIRAVRPWPELAWVLDRPCRVQHRSRNERRRSAAGATGIMSGTIWCFLNSSDSDMVLMRL